MFLQQVESREVHAVGLPAMEPVLIEFVHGLGDAVQLAVVLKHLQRFRPDWVVDVATLIGKHSAYRDLCRNVLIMDRDQIDRTAYRRVYSLAWHECRESWPGYPSTKPSRCLREVFGIDPIPDLCRYTIRRTPQADQRARLYLEQICRRNVDKEERFPVVAIHYEGNTECECKNLSHELAREVCDTVLACGMVPLVLDWDFRSPLPDNQTIFNPHSEHDLWYRVGTGDAEVLAALIDAATLMIGVDSGPLHVAGATTTQTIGVWTRHHPIHYFDLADNVLHLLPDDHQRLAAGPESLAFFDVHYQARTYRHLHIELPAIVDSLLTGRHVAMSLNQRFLKQLRATAFDQRFYEEHRLAGLDYAGFGPWQQQYGRWFVQSFGLMGKRLLDVGCACGAILRGLGEAGAIVQGIDVSEHMIQLGRQRWPDMASLLFVCDAVNLHIFSNGSWDAIHTAQVAEHWKPELVPFILRELARVTRPGGILFCCLDTEELFARQGRRLEYDDPTHVCIRPLTWWHEQLRDAGWEVCTIEFEHAVRAHPESFLRMYDWDWFVARKAS